MLELPKKHIFWFKANRQNPEVDFLVSLTLVELGNEPLHLPSELGVGQCLKLSCGAAPTPALSSFRAASNSSTVALITLGLASAAMTKQDCWQCWRLISEFQLRQESIENWIVASALQKNRSKNHAISRNRPLSCLVLLKFFVQIKRSKLEHPHVFVSNYNSHNVWFLKHTVNHRLQACVCRTSLSSDDRQKCNIKW